MAEWEPKIDDDGSTSYSQKAVVLKDWWLIKCSKEFEGKRFGVAGFEDSVETRAKRVFTSSPIIKALDIFDLETSDGISIILRGLINKERVLKSGFLPEILSEFIIGFPPGWQRICNSCYGGDTSRTTDKNTVTKSSKVQSHANDEPHGGEVLDKAKSCSDVDKDECEAIDNDEDRECKFDESKVQNHANEEDLGDVEIDDECEPIGNTADGCGNVVDQADVVLSDTGDLLNSEERSGQHKVTGASLRRLFKDLDVSTKPGKKRSSKKSGKTLNSDGNVVRPMNRSGTKGQSAVKRKLDGDHGSKNATKESISSEQRKGLKNSSKTVKKGKSKESEWDILEPMNHQGSEVEEDEDDLSWGNTKRKIDFDAEVTPKKEVKKQEVSTDSLGQKRSRSGRILMSPLEFWRNQIPIYDMDRNLIQVKEGRETNSPSSNGKRSVSRKPRR